MCDGMGSERRKLAFLLVWGGRFCFKVPVSYTAGVPKTTSNPLYCKHWGLVLFHYPSQIRWIIPLRDGKSTRTPALGTWVDWSKSHRRVNIVWSKSWIWCFLLKLHKCFLNLHASSHSLILIAAMEQLVHHILITCWTDSIRNGARGPQEKS